MAGAWPPAQWCSPMVHILEKCTVWVGSGGNGISGSFRANRL